MCGVERSGLSQNPVDRLVRALIRTRGEVTPQEVDRIIERMATVPFMGEVRISGAYRDATYLGHTLGRRSDSLFFHLVQRVKQGQWADGTTELEFLEDLRRASRDPAARLVVYERRGGNIATIFVENRMPEDRRGEASLDYVAVVYSADRGRLISGYQASSLEELSLPENPIWLK